MPAAGGGRTMRIMHIINIRDAGGGRADLALDPAHRRLAAADKELVLVLELGRVLRERPNLIPLLALDFLSFLKCKLKADPGQVP